jgi:hypothetical protein
MTTWRDNNREQGSTYEPPALHVLGTVHELTQQICIIGKTFGHPDYFNLIPITNCSA